MELNFPLLTADQIEVKVKQVSQKGAVLLLYKTARTDMELLDKVVGPMNWAVDYREIKENLYCGIGITDDGEHWVWKWDCGIESRADGDGNEKKGEASDAFKRAGFKWGVGRELYTSPFTFAKVETEPNGKGGFAMKDKFARFNVKEIEYEDRRVSHLVITDNHDKVVFSFGKNAMPVGSAEAAQDAGKKKMEQVDQKVKQAEPPKEKFTEAMATQEQLDYIATHITNEDMDKLMKQYGDDFYEHLTYAKAEKVKSWVDAQNKKRAGNA